MASPLVPSENAVRQVVNRQSSIARSRVFLLSPANCGGVRAKMVMSPAANFALAKQLRTTNGAPLGDVFSFMSGLYFRGKLAYARRFARPPGPAHSVAADGVLVITPNLGLCPADVPVTVDALMALARVAIDVGNPHYRAPLEHSARALCAAIDADSDVVLLGSVATGKYADLLLPIFGERLLFPPAFVGRGDMSRGGLLLRCASAGDELDYVSLAGAVRHGQRPPRLEPLTTKFSTTKVTKNPTTKVTKITKVTTTTKSKSQEP